jgi:hypothetical protein
MYGDGGKMINTTFTSENFTLLLSYPFKDPAWKKKLLVALVVFMVPVLSICLLGYVSRIMQRMAGEGGEPYLPEWDDWGQLFIDGLRIFAVSLASMIPILLFILPAMILVYGSVFIPAILSDSNSSHIPAQVMIIPLLGSLGGMLLLMVGTLISLGLSLLAPAAISHVVVKQSISALFKIHEWWAVWRANMGGFLLCMLVVMGFSFALNFVFQFLSLLVFICCPLYFIAVGLLSLYLCLVLFPLYAQLYRDGANKLARQVPTQE